MYISLNSSRAIFWKFCWNTYYKQDTRENLLFLVQ